MGRKTAEKEGAFMTERQSPVSLVTGGGGFLGLAIVRGLLRQNKPVRSFSRKNHPELERLGVEQIRCFTRLPKPACGETTRTTTRPIVWALKM